jgi:hypothetical protein
MLGQLYQHEAGKVIEQPGRELHIACQAQEHQPVFAVPPGLAITELTNGTGQIKLDAVRVLGAATFASDCAAGSLSARPISTPMRRIRSGCARAASGHPVAAPPSVMTNSRRRIWIAM